MLEISLIDWPEDGGRPRLLGRTAEPELLEVVSERIAAVRRRELAELERPVRLLNREPTEEPGRPDLAELADQVEVGE